MKSSVYEVVRFGVVGVAATIVHYLSLVFFVDILGMAPEISNGLAFCVAVSVSYFGQKFWVFQALDRGFGDTPRFLIVAFLGFVGSIAIMALCHGVLDLDYGVGFVCSVVVIPFLTFLANKFWVFQRGVS